MRLADGSFTKLQAIDELTQRDTQPVRQAPRSRNPKVGRLAPKPADTPGASSVARLHGQRSGRSTARGTGS